MSKASGREIHRLRSALRTQNIRFDLVLEKMRQGLCFFDGSKRLIVANARYAELYGIAPGGDPARNGRFMKSSISDSPPAASRR